VAAAVLSFFGLMHSEGIGIGESPLMSASYLCVAVLMVVCTKLNAVPMTQHEIEAEHGGDLEPSELGV
jgi:adenine/guanine/hypoxanthine permease